MACAIRISDEQWVRVRTEMYILDRLLSDGGLNDVVVGLQQIKTTLDFKECSRAPLEES